MKKLFLLLPFVVGCSSIQFVTTDKGQIVDQNNRPLNIVGRPRITCFDINGQVVADGYFIEELEDRSFRIDEFGADIVIVKNPNCQLNSNENPQGD